jgi:hypothetical protein
MNFTSGTVNASVTRFTFTYSIVETQAISSAISGAGTWNKSREQTMIKGKL